MIIEEHGNQPKDRMGVEHRGNQIMSKFKGAFQASVTDGLYMKILRKLSNSFAKSLSIIFEKAWRLGDVTSDITVKKKIKKKNLNLSLERPK